MIPIKTQILCVPYPSDDTSTGGIIVPDSVKKVSNKMKVVKVGKGTPVKPMSIKESQTIIRMRGLGTEVLIDGQLHFLIDSSMVLAINE